MGILEPLTFWPGFAIIIGHGEALKWLDYEIA